MVDPKGYFVGLPFCGRSGSLKVRFARQGQVLGRQTDGCRVQVGWPLTPGPQPPRLTTTHTHTQLSSDPEAACLVSYLGILVKLLDDRDEGCRAQICERVSKPSTGHRIVLRATAGLLELDVQSEPSTSAVDPDKSYEMVPVVHSDEAAPYWRLASSQILLGVSETMLQRDLWSQALLKTSYSTKTKNFGVPVKAVNSLCPALDG